MLLAFGLSAQKWSLPTEMVLTYLDDSIENKIFDLEVVLTSEIDDDNFYQFYVSYSGNIDTFKLRPLNLNSFKPKLNASIKAVLDTLAARKIESDSIIDNYIATLYAEVVLYHRTEEEKPQVATIFLKDSIKVYLNGDKGDKDTLVGQLFDPKAELSFYEGFIEKIQVSGNLKTKNKNVPVSFNNKYSIGISSSRNIQKLGKNNLFSDDEYDEFTVKEIQDFWCTNAINKERDKQYVSRKNKKLLKLNVGDVIRYVKTVDVNANDVSPESISITLNQSNREHKLYRVETSKLFEARIYTDLLGLIDESNPNGIIQIEFDKRFNINTRRFDSWPGYRGGIGFIQYIDAVFTYSKIESDNRFLPPFSGPDNTGIYSYTPLSILQNRNYSVGAMLNLLYYENQNSKFNFNIDAGFLFGRTGLKSDSTETADEFYANNLELPIDFGFHFTPERRVRFSIKDRISWLYILNNDLDLISYKSEDQSAHNFFNTVELNLKVDISNRGKLFTRYRFIHEWADWENNFSQFQFGYSFYILKENGVKSAIND